MTKNKILLAGATGYLGRFITQELIERNYTIKIGVRNEQKVKMNASNLEILEAQIN